MEPLWLQKGERNLVAGVLEQWLEYMAPGPEASDGSAEGRAGLTVFHTALYAFTESVGEGVLKVFFSVSIMSLHLVFKYVKVSNGIL